MIEKAHETWTLVASNENLGRGRSIPTLRLHKGAITIDSDLSSSPFILPSPSLRRV
jgi:hypothetical protein